MGQLGANLRLLAKNLGDSATLSSSFGMSSSLPLTNLQQETQRAMTARTSAAGTWPLRILFASQQTVSMVALTRTNFSSAATAQVKLYSDAAFSVNTYTGSAQPAIITSGLDATLDNDITVSSWDGLRNCVLYFPQRTDVRGIEIDIVDAGNADGYLEATRLWAGSYFEASYDPAFSTEAVQLQTMDASVQGRADDGTMHVDKKYLARKLVLALDYVVDKDLPTMLAFNRRVAKNTECFVSLYPAWGGAKEVYHQGAFRLTDSPTINPYQVGLHKNTMTFEET